MSIMGSALNLGATGGIALALFSATAGAAPRDIQITAPAIDPNLRVEYVLHRDLNLTAAAGRKALNSRVSRAVRRVCEPYEPPVGGMDYSRCRTGAWNGAEPQIDSAIRRAQEMAMTGTSAIPAVAIAITGRR